MQILHSKFAPHKTKKTQFFAVLKMLTVNFENFTEQKQNAAPGGFTECSIYSILKI